MKINKTHKNKRRTVIVLIAVVVVLISGLVAYMIWQRPLRDDKQTTNDKQTDKRVNTVDLAPPTKEQVNDGNESKKETVNKDTGSSSAQSSIVVTLTAVNQNSNMLQIRTLIDNVLTDGSCQLHMTKGPKSVDKTAGVQNLSSSSTCMGFDIPVSELPAGTWNITVNVVSGSQKGTTTGSVDIHS